MSKNNEYFHIIKVSELTEVEKIEIIQTANDLGIDLQYMDEVLSLSESEQELIYLNWMVV